MRDAIATWWQTDPASCVALAMGVVLLVQLFVSHWLIAHLQGQLERSRRLLKRARRFRPTRRESAFVRLLADRRPLSFTDGTTRIDAMLMLENAAAWHAMVTHTKLLKEGGALPVSDDEYMRFMVEGSRQAAEVFERVRGNRSESDVITREGMQRLIEAYCINAVERLGLVQEVISLAALEGQD